MSDADSLNMFELRNSPDISLWMVNDKEISHDEHEAFINSLKSRTDKDYFVVKDNDNEIIGSVNIDYTESGVSERGIFIVPGQHNKGHALRVLTEFYRHARRYFSVNTILTHVKSENAASLRLEEKLGATFEKEEDGYKSFILKL